MKFLAFLLTVALVATSCGSDDIVATDEEAMDEAAETATDEVATSDDAADEAMEEESMADDAGDEAMEEPEEEAMAEPEEEAMDEIFEVTYGIAEPAWIDSFNVQESEGFEIARLLYDGLTDLSSDLSAVPAVAESWESPDNTVWTFTLRDDVMFHDGTPVTAESFVNAFNRVANPENLSDVAYYGSYITGIAGWADVEAGDATEVTGVEAKDDTTLVITLDGPYPLLPKAMSHPVFSPVADAQIDGNTDAPIGNGPYMMDGVWEHDVQVRLVRNENHYGDAGNPDAINFKIFDSIETQYLEAQAGNLDISDVPPEKIENAASDFPDRYIQLDTGSYTYLGFPTQTAPFDNPDIRKALSLAIDRDTIAQVIFSGTRAPANGFAPPLAPGATASCTNCLFDADAAKELFDAAGGVGDEPLKIYFNSGSGHEEWIEAVANGWKQTLGVDAEFIGQEWPSHLETLQNSEHDGPYRLGWLWDLPSAENFLSPLFLSESGDNYSAYVNLDFDAAIEDFKAAPSEADGFGALATAQEILNDDMPVLPIVFGRAQKVFTDRVGNVNYTVFGYTELENVTLN